ncbi:hypothetical protein ACIP5Y_23655 [Nocardia sp. NPDC088792]|uniref:hypothetical protein n=1 Tax=Nocardia sp. NPDC088792 TaxID=3364332 RepID=UPI00383029A9
MQQRWHGLGFLSPVPASGTGYRDRDRWQDGRGGVEQGTQPVAKGIDTAIALQDLAKQLTHRGAPDHLAHLAPIEVDTVTSDGSTPAFCTTIPNRQLLLRYL